MGAQGVDPFLLAAWLSARSMVRALPAPVPDHGGFRVDTGSPDECRRWVYPRMVPGLGRLARTIRASRHLIKLCGPADQLQAALPPGWALHAPAYVMQASGPPGERALTPGYRLELDRAGMVTQVRIWSRAGDLAASGFAGETADIFIYDRIITAPAHRRKSLGHVVMATLCSAKRNDGSPELLVATEEGRALYAALGWTVISPYSTASIPPA